MNWLLSPIRDGLRGMERVLDVGGAGALFAVLIGMLVSWWIYVPLHELAHAYGCIVAGGSVSRLEIDTLYGGSLLSELFPFVVAGSDYAGRLSGFETGGSDAVYLFTVFAPYLLTIIVGVPMLAAMARGPRPVALLYGAAIPWAYAPYVSLVGDYYEIGSILTSRLILGWYPTAAQWRGDDLFKLLGTLFGAQGAGGWHDLLGIGAAFVLGVLLALATCAAGGWYRPGVARGRNDTS